MISAGIFGYPKDKAWRKALQSCNDWINKNPDYDMNIVFAVLDQGIYDLGVKTMKDLGIGVQRKEQIHTFAERYLTLFSDAEAEKYDLNDPGFGDACLELGFRLDACETIKNHSQDAMEEASELRKIVGDIYDADVLGNAILSKWRWITHWAQYASVTDHKYKDWFVIALQRLAELTQY